MPKVQHFVAIDLGASNGRVITGSLTDDKLELKEAHRFFHFIICDNGLKRWNWNLIIKEVCLGLNKACALLNGKIESISCDSWGQDFGLLDSSGKLFYTPVSYRDDRTKGALAMISRVANLLHLSRNNGGSITPISTLCQLRSMVKNEKDILDKSKNMLYVSDLIHYYLCNVPALDKTQATTSPLFNSREDNWDFDLMDKLEIPGSIFPPIGRCGNIVGTVDNKLLDKRLQGVKVVLTAGHDTAAASASIPDMDTGTLFLSLGTWAMLGCCISKDQSFNKTDSSYSLLGLPDNKQALFYAGIGMWLLQESKKIWQKQDKEISYSKLEQMAEQSNINSIIDINKQRFFNPQNMLDEIADECKEKALQIPVSIGDFVKVIYDSLIESIDISIKKLMQVTGYKMKTLHVIGGGSQGEYFCRKLSEYSKIDVTAGPVEASSTGNILLQAKSANKENNIDLIIKNSLRLKHYGAGTNE